MAPSPISQSNPNYGSISSRSPPRPVDGIGGQTKRTKSPADRLGDDAERDSFLPSSSGSHSHAETSGSTTQQSRRKISTFWLLPVVIMGGISRGMSIAPRIEVYTEISCEEIHHKVLLPPPSNLLAVPPSALIRDAYNPLSSPLRFDPSVPSPLNILPMESSSVGREIRVSSPPKECLQDPAVQSRAAGIQATLGIIIGVLTIVTAGYWGQISDAFGRRTTLCTTLFGMAFHDVMYILISIPDTIFRRYAWRFILLGPIVEGLLGGMTTLTAAQNAYLADCGRTGSRSTLFAYFQGVLYIALGLGPQIAGIVVSMFGTDPKTTMFYGGAAFNLVAVCYVLLILPETVSLEIMHRARHIDVDSDSPPEPVKPGEKLMQRIRRARDKLMAPLIIFGPKRKPGGGWDLNMTFLVIAQVTHLLSVGVVPVKYLYAQHTFAWNVKQLGRYISLLWFLRAFHLLLLLPTIVRLIKPRPPPSTGSGALARGRFSHDIKLDYRIAQFSIFIDATGYVLTLLAPARSQTLFVGFTSLASFTAGVNPAVNSLAVSYLLASHNEANIGQMFGGLSMLQAVSHTLQPFVFGFVYSETVATYPKAIFAFAAGLVISSSALFTLLRTDVEPRAEVRSQEQGGGG